MDLKEIGNGLLQGLITDGVQINNKWHINNNVQRSEVTAILYYPPTCSAYATLPRR
jgi:hypothetical protein